MAGMRDVLIHDYMGVDLTIIWNIIIKELPQVENTLNQILRQNN